MNPITHCLTGWLIAQADALSKRDRALVTIAAVIPDVDALGMIPELLTRDSENPLLWWSSYHHVISHNIGFGLLITGVSYVLARKKWLTSALVLLSFHIHLLGDLIGARGPDGYQWPIPYLLPFSNAWQLTWSGQWELNAWPNILITFAVLAGTFYLSWRRGFSPLELISSRADRAFVATLRGRFKSGVAP
jgi:hypothetical protein